MIDSTVHSRRIEALRALLAQEGLGSAILSRPQHLFYFTGAMPGIHPAFLIVTARNVVAAAPSPMAGLETFGYTSYDIHHGWSVVEGAAAALDEALDAAGLASGAAGVELAHLPARFTAIASAHAGELRGLEDLLWGLRHIKDADDIARIQAVEAGNDRAFAAIRDAARPGVEELALWQAAYRALSDTAGEVVALDGDLGSGLRGVNPDAKPGHNRLAAGEAVFADIYTPIGGYFADTTRCFVIGRPSDLQRQVHSVLVDALAAGEAALRPGVRACDVYRAVRDVIERAGYGENFPHHAGHAFGIFPQERPFLIPAEPMLLEPGMTATLEPGIYIPGWGGMRLEGNYVLAAVGPRRLDHFPSELTVCGG
jgi:Xaa-Pro aminopeptidase